MNLKIFAVLYMAFFSILIRLYMRSLSGFHKEWQLYLIVLIIILVIIPIIMVIKRK